MVIENSIDRKKLHKPTYENELNFDPGKSTIVKYLVEHGAIIDIENLKKETALDMAFDKGQYIILRD